MPRGIGYRVKILTEPAQNRISGTAHHLARQNRPLCSISCCGLDGYRHFGSSGFHGTLFFRGLLASLTLLSGKCCSSFRFFNKVPENIERCYMSKKYAKGGRFDYSLTRSNVKMREKISQIGAQMGLNRGSSRGSGVGTVLDKKQGHWRAECLG